VRKPAKSKAQRAYDKEKRLLLRLRKTAVRWSTAVDTDTDGSDDGDHVINGLTDLQSAAQAYANNLTPRERKKLLKCAS
jgi:hypothetical protein